MAIETSKIVSCDWWVVATKPHGEFQAKKHLEAQGMCTYLPIIYHEVIRRGSRLVKSVPLFSRYLFLLNNTQAQASIHTIRSTRGVSHLLMADEHPAIAKGDLIDAIRSFADNTQRNNQNYFRPGDPVCIINGPFSGLEGVYQMDNGELRSMVLLEFMHKSHVLSFKKTQLKKQ